MVIKLYQIRIEHSKSTVYFYYSLKIIYHVYCYLPSDIAKLLKVRYQELIRVDIGLPRQVIVPYQNLKNIVYCILR